MSPDALNAAMRDKNEPLVFLPTLNTTLEHPGLAVGNQPEIKEREHNKAIYLEGNWPSGFPETPASSPPSWRSTCTSAGHGSP